MRAPRKFTENELKKVGVILVDEDKLLLRCTQCGKGWQPQIQPGGKLRRGYWKCPDGCNNPRSIFFNLTLDK